MSIPFFNLGRLHQQLKIPIQMVIQEILEGGKFIRGFYCNQFENRFAKLLDRKYCVGVGSGTEALFFALKALNIGEGDEVITSPYSFIASSACISQVGASVVFADCYSQTGNINPEEIIHKITSKTKAILVVHLYGQPANMKQIKQIAQKYQLFIIEDCAQAHHAKINNQPIGSFGDVACFSFYPTKNIGACGNAGAVLSDDESLITRLKLLVNHGRVGPFYHCIEGLNSQLDEIQAAILNLKLDYIELWHQQRRKIAYLYNNAFKAYCSCPIEVSDQEHAYHLYVIQSKYRDKVKQALFNKGIESIVHYPMPLPFLEAYRDYHYTASQFPMAWKLKDRVLSLPLHPYLLESEIEYILSETSNILKQYVSC